MLSDIRYAIRQLRRAPGFTLAAMLTLGVGLSANATVFSLVNAVLLRPTPHVREPGRLVALYTSDYSGPAYGTNAYPDVEAFERGGREAGVFAGVAAFAPRQAAAGDEATRERVLVEVVSPTYLAVLGVAPALGRAFTDDEARGAGASAVVISDALWRRSFGGDPAALGRAFPLNGRPATVVGVLPPGFGGSTRGVAVDVWAPVAVAARFGIDGVDVEHRGSRSLQAIARLAPGVSQRRAEQAMALVARRLHAAYPDAWTDVRRQPRRITVLSERLSRVPPQVRGPVLAFAGLLVATVGLVLVVCCANVAGLLLARGMGRGREVGVRLSLGATRGRLFRQLITESVVTSALAGALALVLTAWAAQLLARAPLPADVPISLDLTPDWRVLAFSALLATAAGVVFGLAPALRASRVDAGAVLRTGASYGVAARGTRLQRALVAGQLATSLVLLVASLLFLGAVRAASDRNPGFSARSMLLVPIGPKPGVDANAMADVGRRVQERLAGAPGVAAVSWASTVPLGFEFSRRGTAVEGYTPAEGEDMEFGFNVVGPAYFETLGVPLARGRGFAAADRAGAAPVVVVNEAFAARFWPGQDPIGKRVSVRGRGGPYAEVVGVARDGKYQSLAEAPRPYLYVPALQDDGWGVTLHVRLDRPGRDTPAADPRALLGAVREAVAAVAPDWELGPERTLAEHVAMSMLPQRVAGPVLGAFGMLALALASVGVYGVVAYAVARRTREIGVRVALGARGADVLRLVLEQNLGLVAWGLAVGLPLAWGASRLLRGLLVGAGTADPLAFAAGTLGLVAVALAATYLPARRATRVAPTEALRAE